MKRWLLVLAACKDSAPPQKQPPPTTIAADPCEARAKRLSDHLETLYKAQPGELPIYMPRAVLPGAPEHAKLVDVPGLVFVLAKDGTVGAIGRSLALSDGKDLVHDWTQETLTRASELTSPATPLVLYFWVDKDVKAGVLASLLETVADNTPQLRLLVAGEPGNPDALAPLRARPTVKAYVASLPSQERAARVQRNRQLHEAARPCEPLWAALAGPAITDGPMLDQLALVRAVPQAIAQCRCQIADLDVLEYALLSMSGATAPTPRFVELAIPDGLDMRTITELAEQPIEPEPAGSGF